MIRHADGRFGGSFRPPSAVVPLTIPVICPSFNGLLMLPIRFQPLPPPRLLPALITAITVPTVTGAANMKNNSTANTPAFAENGLGMFPLHPRSIAGWTSGHPS